ncbi:carnitine O-palmitoyltransferase 1, muscle isoform [Diorhabda carinulata]|uniref:carnitine O-palmitoyltransferase 1, muscle isoform n=1 Tax=Diorhabda carinulata TaxID=1163345 RepID=UPI0025A05710|nr:carnitine O-palmitoyltransferase 1, muscle isoform [Diorhabda carinulata]XP_057662083.1 carnitine O-palmitoyltransferase 1, muscle isoform [Diorhabda carinulata]
MAEAHSAVAFSFAITHEGLDVNFDREVLHLVWESGVRSWKKRVARFQNSIHNGVYPGHYRYLFLLISLAIAFHWAGVKVPFNLTNRLLDILPGDTLFWQLSACFLTSLVFWLTAIYILRYILKLLFMYKGWMYESRARGSTPSLKTRIWLALVKIFSGWNTPRLYSYQGSLPRLPLPEVHNTMQRYLKSVKALLDEEQYVRMEKLATEFENGIGKKLQRYLILKSWWSTNYVSDWWEEYVYLRGRSPLMINSNFYGIDALLFHPTKIQAARAGSVIYSLLVFRRLVERQELEPILVQGLVPLCSWQYERIFNTTRIPGKETDRIVHWLDSNHIVVYHKGRYFKVIIYKGRILKPCEIQIQIQQILDDESEPLPGEEKLAALTAGERTHWATVRLQMFNKGVNKSSLDTIEKAAFVVALDDFPYNYDPEDPSKLDQYGRMLLHGKGYDRWFDKSFTMCIGTNGRIGFNAEHSWADAAIMSHLWEFLLTEEIGESRYDETGNTVGKPEIVPPTPVRLNWELKFEAQDAIEKSVRVANELIKDINLRIFVHDHYGKGFMKTCEISPDAYIQMALQLAYFRDAGKFCLTYEATMTRLYREGRTETLRPVTVDSVAWVKSMENQNSNAEERVRLLKVACNSHQTGYQDAMCGKGIDRHLFCLYVVSKYLEVDSPFLKEVLSEPWRLSTSQTPHGQTSRLDLKKHPKCISAGGGFGPVADDGYGVSYIIAGEDLLFFHVSNKNSCPTTDCHRFAKKIEEALADMKKSFLEFRTQTGKK